MGHSDNDVSIISVSLSAKGDPIQVEFHPDGDIVFWRDDAPAIELDREGAALIRTALKQQAEVMRVFKTAARGHSTLGDRSLPLRASLPAVTSIASSRPSNRRPSLSVAKDGDTWGATVLVDGHPVRYQYQYRDQARAASADHSIGEAGRLS